MRVLIIGAGLGGLTAAIALRRAGHSVEVCERAPQLREVGAGIGLWGGTLEALRQIGLADAVVARGERMQSAEFRLAGGRLLVQASATDFAAVSGEAPALVHRAALLEELAKALPPGAIQCGNEFESVVLPENTDGSAPEPLRVRFEDGKFRTPDLLIGADGLHSRVRGALFGTQPPDYAGYTCWRGLVPCTTDRVAPGFIGEYWGRGARFGITRIGGGLVYWWATRNAPPCSLAPGGHDPEAQSTLTQTFAAFVPPVPELIAATEPARIIRNDIFDRPPLSDWRRGRVLLIGDAAHPTTPNLGQGGCMAIEDAVLLGAALQGATLADGRDLEARLTSFVTRRQAVTDNIVRESRRFGALGQWSNPWACAARDLLLRWTAKSRYKQVMQRVGRPLKP